MSCWLVEKHCDLGLFSFNPLAQKPLCQEICSSVANKYALLFRNGMSKRIIPPQRLNWLDVQKPFK
jgi:hypothetical protein